MPARANQALLLYKSTPGGISAPSLHLHPWRECLSAVRKVTAASLKNDEDRARPRATCGQSRYGARRYVGGLPSANAKRRTVWRLSFLSPGSQRWGRTQAVSPGTKLPAPRSHRVQHVRGPQVLPGPNQSPLPRPAMVATQRVRRASSSRIIASAMLGTTSQTTCSTNARVSVMTAACCTSLRFSGASLAAISASEVPVLAVRGGTVELVPISPEGAAAAEAATCAADVGADGAVTDAGAEAGKARAEGVGVTA